jgi:hypothetical protein
MLNRSFSDYVLGVGLNEYYDAAPEFEISFISYLSVCGLIFGLVNLAILYGFVRSTLKQIKASIKKKRVDRQIIEIQVANLLFVLSMFLSTIHFPVITNYLGSLIIIFHLSFGFYILKKNRATMARSEAE